MKRRDFLKVAGGSVAWLALGTPLMESCSKGEDNGNDPVTPVDKPTGHFSLWQLTSASDNIGNSYVMKTAAGHLIIMDGGMENNGDAAKLRSYIKSQGNNKVDAWWLSHPHGDHIGAFLNITDNPQGITIDKVYYSKVADSITEGRALTTRFNNKLAELSASGVDVVNLSLGARYDMDDIFIKVLGIANPEFTTASEGTSVLNEQSVIVRFEDDSKSVVFTGDASEQAGTKCITKYSKYLNCDYMQMAHHGQRGVRESFYKNIDFKHCLWPTPKWLWNAAEGNSNNYMTWATRKWMDEKGIPAENHHVAWRDIDWHLA